VLVAVEVKVKLPPVAKVLPVFTVSSLLTAVAARVPAFTSNSLLTVVAALIVFVPEVDID
jgi:hypothetical protein